MLELAFMWKKNRKMIEMIEFEFFSLGLSNLLIMLLYTMH